MCTTTISTLTLAGMLHDPLIRLVMRSDGVSEQDLSELLGRVKDSLVARSSEREIGGEVISPALAPHSVAAGIS